MFFFLQFLVTIYQWIAINAKPEFLSIIIQWHTISFNIAELFSWFQVSTYTAPSAYKSLPPTFYLAKR